MLPASRSSSVLISSSSLLGFVLSIRYGIVMGSPTVKARTLYPEIDETEFILCIRTQWEIDLMKTLIVQAYFWNRNNILR